MNLKHKTSCYSQVALYRLLESNVLHGFEGLHCSIGYGAQLREKPTGGGTLVLTVHPPPPNYAKYINSLVIHHLKACDLRNHNTIKDILRNFKHFILNMLYRCTHHLIQSKQTWHFSNIIPPLLPGLSGSPSCWANLQTLRDTPKQLKNKNCSLSIVMSLLPSCQRKNVSNSLQTKRITTIWGCAFIGRSIYHKTKQTTKG